MLLVLEHLLRGQNYQRCNTRLIKTPSAYILVFAWCQTRIYNTITFDARPTLASLEAKTWSSVEPEIDLGTRVLDERLILKYVIEILIQKVRSSPARSSRASALPPESVARFAGSFVVPARHR